MSLVEQHTLSRNKKNADGISSVSTEKFTKA